MLNAIPYLLRRFRYITCCTFLFNTIWSYLITYVLHMYVCTCNTHDTELSQTKTSVGYRIYSYVTTYSLWSAMHELSLLLN